MKVMIKRAGFDEETAFRNIFQFYIYEFSRFMGWTTTMGGRFIEGDLDGCWTDDNDDRHPYLFYVDGRLAGMAIIDVLEKSRYDDDPNPVTDMSEFFIMAGLQGKGIGRKIAIELFKRYPGRWHVHQLKENVNAQHFWRKVIDEFSDGNYREVVRMNGDPVQFFEVSSAGG